MCKRRLKNTLAFLTAAIAAHIHVLLFYVSLFVLKIYQVACYNADNNFNQNVLEQSGVIVVDFWAQWCGPCRKLTPLLEQIQNEFKDEIKIFKIDADKNINSAKEFGISSLPSVLIFKDGEVKEFMAGMMQKSAIVSNIKKYLS